MTLGNENNPHVIVVGAGFSGLASAYSLKRSGLNVLIIEQASQVADAWRHRHPQLRLNTHKAISGLPGLEMPWSDGAFLGRDSVIRYLEDYAEFIDVPIKFEVTVNTIESDGERWRLDTDNGEFWATHVVVATGFDRVPCIPKKPDLSRYQGNIKHAAEFGNLSGYRGKKILVVGAGNSGTDILNHLATISTKNIWVSIRHGPVIFPTRLLGVSIQLLSPVLEKLPVKVVDAMLKLTERIAFGDLEPYGMKKHTDGGASRLLRDGIAPAIDNGFVAALKKGQVEVVPEIAGYDNSSVYLTDGRNIEPEVIIFATGYRTGLEQILGQLDILDKSGLPTTHGDEQDLRYPGLWFNGMRPMLSGFFRAAGHTGESIAKAITKINNQ